MRWGSRLLGRRLLRGESGDARFLVHFSLFSCYFVSGYPFVLLFGGFVFTSGFGHVQSIPRLYHSNSPRYFIPRYPINVEPFFMIHRSSSYMTIGYLW